MGAKFQFPVKKVLNHLEHAFFNLFFVVGRFNVFANLAQTIFLDILFCSEKELFIALNPFKEYFSFEDFKYDYVTFEDDNQKDSPLLELAKDVLRTHSNRYTLSVLCRKMNESNTSNTVLDDTFLKALLLSRKCFMIEERSITYFTLSTMGEAYDIEPIRYTKPAKSEEERQKEMEEKIERKRLREQEKQAKEQEKRIRKAILDELKEKKLRRKQKLAEHKEERRIESIKIIITYYQINDYLYRLLSNCMRIN